MFITRSLKSHKHTDQYNYVLIISGVYGENYYIKLCNNTLIAIIIIIMLEALIIIKE